MITFLRDELLEFVLTIVQMSWDAVIMHQVLKLSSETLFIFMNIEK